MVSKKQISSKNEEVILLGWFELFSWNRHICIESKPVTIFSMLDTLLRYKLFTTQVDGFHKTLTQPNQIDNCEVT